MKNAATEIDYSEYMAAPLLWEALNRYCDPKTLQAYSDTLKTTENKQVKTPSDLISGLNAMVGIVSEFTQSNQNRNRLYAELQNQLLVLIKSGDLLPCGFEEPRKSTDNPIKIPVDIFISGKINWEKSEIQNKNLEFSGIRVLDENAKIKTNKFQRSGNLIIEDKKSEKLNFDELNPSQYLNEKDAAKYLGISHRTLQGLRTKGGGPEFAKLGKAVRYKAADLIKWTNGNKRENTSV